MRILNRQTVSLSVGAFLVMIGVSLVAPILPLYARQFGVSRTAAGALISSFAVARLLFDVAGGVLADRWGARRVMVAGALLLSAGSVVAALAPTYGVLVVARVVEGIGSAAYATAAGQLLVAITPRERLGRTMAVYQTGLLGGIAVGPVIGGYAAELGNFTTPFWIYAGIGVLVAAVVGVLVRSSPTHAATLRETLRASARVLRSGPFLALLFVTFAIFVMRAGARITLIPLYAGEELGLAESDIGVILAVSAVATVFVVNPGGWLVDRIGRKPVLIAGLLLTAAATAGYGMLNTFASLVVLSVGFGVVAAFAGIPPPTLAGDLAPPDSAGAAFGIYRMAGDLGIVVGPLVVGAIADRGAFGAGFLTAAGVLVVAAVVALLIPETGGRRVIAEDAGI